MEKFDDYINITAPLHSATVKGKLGNANEIFLEGDTKNIENEIKEINSRHEELNKKHDTLSSKHESLSRTVQGITVTGGANTATNVTYNNDTSGLNAENAQDAIDEVSSIGHLAKRGSTINISTNYNSDHIAEVLTLKQAINKVPSSCRVLGFQGKFLTESGWDSYIFNGSDLTQWGNVNKWVKQSPTLLQNKGALVNYIYMYYVSSADGSLFYDPNRCTIAYIKGNYNVTLNEGYNIENIVAYDLTGKFVKKLSINDNKTGLLTRITFSKTDNSSFNGSEQPIKSLNLIDTSFIDTYNITDIPDSSQKTFAYVDIKKGSYINIRAVGDGNWDRLLIGINGNNSERLFDKMINNKDYYLYCDKDISSLWAYITGLTGKLQIELNVNLAALSKKQPQIDEDIKSLENNLQYQGSIVSYVYNHYTSSIDGVLVPEINRATTGFLPGNYNYTVNDGFELLNIVVYDLVGNFLKRVSSFKEVGDDKLLRISFKKTDNSYFTGNEKIINSVVNNRTSSNILEGKKWAVCGDSFSNGDFTGSTEDNTISKGLYAGKDKVYGYLIGNRNNMIIQHMALGGRTLATPSDLSFTNAFSYIQNQKANSNYTQIDEDADYATFYFGINDSHHRPGATGSDGEEQTGIIEIGTIDDNSNTTFYGAWNVMLKWIVNNRPFTKLGIIVSNGCEIDEYRIATIEIAKKWGIPYIDLNGDERTPVMLRSTNPNVSSVVKTARLNSQRVTTTNNHPNSKAHEYESTFIENFLRSL